MTFLCDITLWYSAVLLHAKPHPPLRGPPSDGAPGNREVFGVVTDGGRLFGAITLWYSKLLLHAQPHPPQAVPLPQRGKAK